MVDTWKQIGKDKLSKLYYEDGLSIYQIGEMFNVDGSTVRRKMIKYHLKRDHPIVQRQRDEYDDIKQVPTFFMEYDKIPRENISIPIPIKAIGSKEPQDATITIVLSDLHLAHSDFLPETYESTIGTTVEILKKMKEMFNIKAVNVVLNGDIVSGKGVYPLQELDNLLSRGHWQVFLAEIILKETFDAIEKVIPINNVHLVRGTHDSISENYLLYLKRTLVGNGYNVFYCGSGFVKNIAEPIGTYNVFFTHGRGSSEYSPISTVMVRDLWKAFNQYKLKDIPIERACTSHTHWISTNIDIEGMIVDVTGGFQRWSKSQSQRPCGLIMYLYTMGETSSIAVRPNIEIESREKSETGLEYKNISYYGTKLQKHLSEVEGLLNESNKK
jgi:hypothetical protein